MVTGAVPDEVSVSCSTAAEPICTSPKFKLESLSVRAGEVLLVPFPLSDTFTGDPVSVARLNCPFEAPAFDGSKTTSNVTRCPGCSVSGAERFEIGTPA